MTERQFKRGAPNTHADVSEKRARQKVIGVVRKLSGLRGRDDRTTERYLLNLGKQIVGRGEDAGDVERLWRNWRRAEPNKYSAPSYDRVRQFYYWLKNSQLSIHDAVIAEAYYTVAENLNVDSVTEIERSEFRGYGDVIVERLTEWRGEAGNAIEDLIVDYLLAVFRRALEWKPAILSDLRVSLGKYGWKVWIEWVDTKGGRSAYLLPSLERQAEHRSRRTLIDELHELRIEAIDYGGVELYDEIGRKATGLDDEALRKLIDDWRETIGNGRKGRRGRAT